MASRTLTHVDKRGRVTMVDVSDKTFSDCTVPDPKGDEHLKLF